MDILFAFIRLAFMGSRTTCGDDAVPVAIPIDMDNKKDLAILGISNQPVSRFRSFIVSGLDHFGKGIEEGLRGLLE